MSDGTVVETEAGKPEAAEDEAAIWKDLQTAEAGQVADTPDEANGEAGQAGTGTPQGQAEPSTPGEDTAQPSASEETTDDPWAKADPKLREAYEAERAARQKAEHVATIHGGRLSQALNDLSQLRTRMDAAEKPAGGETEKQAEAREALYKRLEDEYADSVGKLVPEFKAMQAEIDTLRGRLSSQDGQQTEAVLLEQQGVLERAHPDYEQVVNTQAYLDWANQQPGYVQQTLRDNARQIIDGASCADIISRYKAETAPKLTPEQQAHDERRREQQEALLDPSLRGPKVTGGDSDDPDVIWRDMQAKERREAAGAR